MTLGSTVDDNGMVIAYQPNGNELLVLGPNDSDGMVNVSNKTCESVAQIRTDEYCNGYIIDGNRKCMGRMLKPGP